MELRQRLGPAAAPFTGPEWLKCIWEFRKIGDTLFWGPYDKDPTLWGTILWSPIFGNSHGPNGSKTPIVMINIPVHRDTDADFWV